MSSDMRSVPDLNAFYYFKRQVKVQLLLEIKITVW